MSADLASSRDQTGSAVVRTARTSGVAHLLGVALFAALTTGARGSPCHFRAPPS